MSVPVQCTVTGHQPVPASSASSHDILPVPASSAGSHDILPVPMSSPVSMAPLLLHHVILIRSEGSPPFPRCRGDPPLPGPPVRPKVPSGWPGRVQTDTAERPSRGEGSPPCLGRDQRSALDALIRKTERYPRHRQVSSYYVIGHGAPVATLALLDESSSVSYLATRPW
jgi:hypothetical protein